jgi:hypothetical protein
LHEHKKGVNWTFCRAGLAPELPTQIEQGVLIIYD